ncbi:MAG TPA: response regulator, partial [Vicinamibacteria bacterium]|nr:response regulator [Vicinamibacteria bacterium]
MAEFRNQEKGLPAPRPGARGDASPRSARILVVEDNEDVRQMMAVALQTHGYSVAEAADGEEALRH